MMRLNGKPLTRVEIQTFAAQAREMAATARSTKVRKSYEAAAIFAEEAAECVRMDDEPIVRIGQGDYRREMWG